MHRTNDLLLTNRSGENLKLFNIRISETDNLINGTGAINSGLIVEKLHSEIGGILISGLFYLGIVLFPNFLV